MPGSRWPTGPVGPLWNVLHTAPGRRRVGARSAGQPAGRRPAPQSAQVRGTGAQSRRGNASRLPARADRSRGVTRRSRPVLGRKRWPPTPTSSTKWKEGVHESGRGPLRRPATRRGTEMTATLMSMARAERADLAEFLATLTPQDWAMPTLCVGWTVKDVVAHVISYEELGPLGLLKRFAKGWLVRANQVGVDEFAALTPSQLLQLLRDHLEPRGLTAGFGGMIALVDGTIHHQDIRRSLGRPRTVPTDRLDPRPRSGAGQPPARRWTPDQGIAAARHRRRLGTRPRPRRHGPRGGAADGDGRPPRGNRGPRRPGPGHVGSAD